ncbi:MAG: hypothetical protein QNJ55_22920 [Xenococcus sp. MO_188.B8]|nr:hypothetical protein [Xenococcus sp. MO_188.B8]
MKINTNFNLTELINLESKVLKEKLRQSENKNDPEIQASLVLIYRELSALNRQLTALPEESEINFSSNIDHREYLNSFWGSD